MVICLERGADLHMVQLMPLPLTVSCSSKIQIGFTFLVPAYPGCPSSCSSSSSSLFIMMLSKTIKTDFTYEESYLCCFVFLTVSFLLFSALCQVFTVRRYANTVYAVVLCLSVGPLTLLVGRPEGHPACKKTERWGAGLVICLERGADLHIAQLMPLPLTVSCFSKIQIGFTFLVPAYPGSPGKRAVKWVCVCVVSVCLSISVLQAGIVSK